MKKRSNQIRLLLIILLITGIQFNEINSQVDRRVDSLIALLPAANDSLNYLINSTLAVEYFYNDIEKSKEYIDAEIEIAIANDYEGRLADAYIHKASYFSNVGSADSSFYYFDLASDLVEAKNITSHMARLYTNYGTTCNNLGYWDRGLEMLQKSQKAIENTKPDTFLTIRNFSSIGSIHGELKNYKLSNQYFDKTYFLAQAIDNKDEMIWSRMMKGTNLLEMQQVEKAKQYFKECLIFYKTTGQKFEEARALSNYGNALQSQDSLLSAKAIYTEGKELGDILGYADVKIEFIQRLATINMELGDYNAAIPFLKESLPLNIEMGSIINQARDHDLLATCYNEVGNYSNAYENLNIYVQLNDSIMSAEKVKDINELESKYQTEKKEQEIILLEEKNKRNDLVSKVMTSAIIGLVVLFGMMFYAMRQRLMNNKLAKENAVQELEFNQKELGLRKQELTAYALQLAQKNEILEGIKSDVAQIKSSSTQNGDLQKIVNTISINQTDDESWESFRKRFLAVHKDFEKNVKIKFPKVTVNELRVMALLKMQLSSKEIANILNISAEGIKKARYRLRKKLDMESGESLELLILEL